VNVLCAGGAREERVTLQLGDRSSVRWVFDETALNDFLEALAPEWGDIRRECERVALNDGLEDLSGRKVLIQRWVTECELQ